MMRSAQQGHTTRSILTFQLTGKLFGLYADAVQEVLPAMQLQPLPDAPDNVKGLLLRGQMIPVVSPHPHFSLPSPALAPEHHLIVLQLPQRRLALHVDRALKLIQQTIPSKLEPLCDHQQGTSQCEQLVLLHDPAALLTNEIPPPPPLQEHGHA